MVTPARASGKLQEANMARELSTSEALDRDVSALLTLLEPLTDWEEAQGRFLLQKDESADAHRTALSSRALDYLKGPVLDLARRAAEAAPRPGERPACLAPDELDGLAHLVRLAPRVLQVLPDFPDEADQYPVVADLYWALLYALESLSNAEQRKEVAHVA
jgi:hypothetical protein